MKLRDFLKILDSIGFVYVRDAKHIIYKRGDYVLAVPRHKELSRKLTNDLLKKVQYVSN